MKIKQRFFLILVIHFVCVPFFAQTQVNTKHYRIMYDCIIDALHIDKAYVSDSLRELETLGYFLYEAQLRDSIPIYNPNSKKTAEYLSLLKLNFNTIEDLPIPFSPCSNIIYFSFCDGSYICANVYVCVNNMSRTDVFPVWWCYRDLYSFFFQIKDDDAVFLQKTQWFEM